MIEFVFIFGFISGQILLIIFIFLVLKLFLLNTSPPKPQKSSFKPKTSKASDAKITAKFNVQLKETCQFASILLAQITQIIRSDASLIERMLEKIDLKLNEYAKKTGILSDVQVTDLSLGEEFLILTNARIHQDDNLQVLIDFEYDDQLKFAIDTNVLVNWPKPLIGSLPISLAFTLLKLSGTVLSALILDSN